jgi:RNase H-fold protein (predicted Holliday junction resolvase)
VHRCDERLSTWEARDRSKRQRGVDAVAAQVILESWLAGQGQAAAGQNE